MEEKITAEELLTNISELKNIYGSDIDKVDAILYVPAFTDEYSLSMKTFSICERIVEKDVKYEKRMKFFITGMKHVGFDIKTDSVYLMVLLSKIINNTVSHLKWELTL